MKRNVMCKMCGLTQICKCSFLEETICHKSCLFL